MGALFFTLFLFLSLGFSLERYSLSIPFVKLGRGENAYFRTILPAGEVVVTPEGEILYLFGKSPLREVFLTRKSVRPEGDGKTTTLVSYFLGPSPSAWRSRLPTYESVDLGEVWKGVRVKVKAYAGTAEKLFFLEKAEYAGNILVKLEGVKSISIGEKGELLLESGDGEIRFSPPKAFSLKNDREIRVRYRILSRNVYGFALEGDYDPEEPVVIDPIVYSTYLGGSSMDGHPILEDRLHVLAVRSDGTVVVGGSTTSADFPVTDGAYQTEFNSPGTNVTDVFVAIVRGNLSEILYATYIGGSSSDYLYGLEVSPTGEVYLTGTTLSADFPTTPEAYRGTCGRSQDVFVLKLSSDLSSLLASTCFGSTGDDEGHDVALTPEGDVVVVGYAGGSDFPVQGGFFRGTYDDGEAFIARFSSDLSTLGVSTFLGGDFVDRARVVSVLPDGRVVVAGETNSSDFPTTTGPYGETGGPNTFNTDVFVSVLLPNLSGLSGSTYLGGNLLDELWDLTVDGDGNVYIVGYTGGGFPVTEGVYTGSGRGFLAKLSPNLQLLKSTVLDGSRAKAVALSLEGDIFVGGDIYDDPVTGRLNILLLKLSRDFAELMASVIFGGSENETLLSMSTLRDGNLLFVGRTDSTDFPVTEGALQKTYGGNTDMFITVLTPNLDTSPPNGAPVIESFTAQPSGGTAPLEVTFEWSVSDPDGDILTCVLDFGDGTSPLTVENCAADNSTTHTYATEGTYTALLQVRDGRGGEASSSLSITVPAEPNASPVVESFTSTPSRGTAPLNVVFSWRITDPDGDSLTCRLDFDGNGSWDKVVENCPSEGSAETTYDGAGNYRVLFQVTDGTSSVEKTLYVEVAAPQPESGGEVTETAEPVPEEDGDEGPLGCGGMNMINFLLIPLLVLLRRLGIYLI